MTRKELINLLFDERNEKTIKLLRDFPCLLRDVYVLNEYDENCKQNKTLGIHANKQRSRDAVLAHFKIGVNHFYKIQKKVKWILTKM